MIRITRETDYGLVLLALLGSLPEGAIRTSRDLAKEAGLPLPMASKILKVLARHGLLRSHRGVKGGYSLAQPLESVSLARVIQVMEGPIGMTECTSSPGCCEQEARCPVRFNWQRVSGAVREVLEGISLSEMLAPETPAPLSIGTGGRGGS